MTRSRDQAVGLVEPLLSEAEAWLQASHRVGIFFALDKLDEHSHDRELDWIGEGYTSAGL